MRYNKEDSSSFKSSQLMTSSDNYFNDDLFAHLEEAETVKNKVPTCLNIHLINLMSLMNERLLTNEGSFHRCDQLTRRSGGLRDVIDEGSTWLSAGNVAGAIPAGFPAPQRPFDVHQSDHFQVDGQSRQRRRFRLLFLQFRRQLVQSRHVRELVIAVQHGVLAAAALPRTADVRLRHHREEILLPAVQDLPESGKIRSRQQSQ